MILSDFDKTVFCHIPKNGGSSLRRHFLSSWRDARQYHGLHSVGALDGALRNLTHITVNEARQWFNDDLLARRCDIIAVVRAPIPRLSSALLQYVRSCTSQHRHFVTADQASDVLKSVSVIDLCRRSFTDVQAIHFRPQVDFIEGVPKENLKLIPIDMLSTRFPKLPIENPGGRMPTWMKWTTHRTAKPMINGIPAPLKTRLARNLIRRDPAVDEIIAQKIDAHRSWLEDFYARDHALYHAHAPHAAKALSS